MDSLGTLVIDIWDFQKGIEDINKLEYAVERGFQNGLSEVADKMFDKMFEYLGEYGLGGSNLASTISIYPSGDGILISVGAEYGMYVEFGSGIVGKGDPHPKSDSSKYDLGDYSEDGWLYYDKKRGNKLRWTKGSRPKPFVYQTWLYGSRIYHQTITKHINREIKKVTGVKK